MITLDQINQKFHLPSLDMDDLLKVGASNISDLQGFYQETVAKNLSDFFLMLSEVEDIKNQKHRETLKSVSEFLGSKELMNFENPRHVLDIAKAAIFNVRNEMKRGK